jgi:hypothetical protein
MDIWIDRKAIERLKLPPKLSKRCYNQAKKGLGRLRKNRLWQSLPLQALTYE